MKWTTDLPTVPGFYWFKDIDCQEEGMACVDTVHHHADILIYPTHLDSMGYVSSAYWNPNETAVKHWFWYGPISIPPLEN